jgi:hypothetical protein
VVVIKFSVSSSTKSWKMLFQSGNFKLKNIYHKFLIKVAHFLREGGSKGKVRPSTGHEVPEGE